MLDVNLNPYKSIVIVDAEGELITVSEGDTIQFVIESTSEVKKGVVTKFMGKDEKLKIQVLPEKSECQEIWGIVSIAEGSLELLEMNEEPDDDEE
ncbi:MAG: hypothetical protein LLF98_02835 [Clostridium sp.]|uniref:hypothetical protein n=1 Tax=Clostridium sp. TaxID=1506 RepID=UPI0025BD10CF|nr:hypothetical protein [Clostridium sp.]MCE5220220.1 hypothetical protein [Clostridium sp.]